MLVESVAAPPRGRILAREFAPGSFLRDVRMAEEHETLRHTFRADGLLRQEAFRGFYVPEFGPDDVVDITRMRAPLEGEAVRTIIQFGETPPDALSALEVMRRGPKDTAALEKADRDFHRAIVNAVRNERLSEGYVAIEVELELLLTQRQAYHDPGRMYEEPRTDRLPQEPRRGRCVEGIPDPLERSAKQASEPPDVSRLGINPMRRAG